MLPGTIMHIYSYIPDLLNVTVNVSTSNEAISLCFCSVPSTLPSSSFPCVSCLNEDIPENVSGSLYFLYYHNVSKLQKRFIQPSANSIHT